jgi:predicted ArsR family transcriptional regulator
MFRKQLLDTTRGRIVSLLQRGGLTAHDIAASLELTPTAIRAQLTAMERDGLVQRAGRRSGTTRPANVFELTPEVEQLLSRAYIPFLTELVGVFSAGLPSGQLDDLMRAAGRSLAAGMSRPTGNLEARVAAASALLNEQLGALTRVEKNGRFVIKGVSCPLAALTGKHPGVCLAIESLVAEIVGASVKECCDRGSHPACCFEIGNRRRR